MDRLTIDIQDKQQLEFLEDLLNRLNIHFQKSSKNGISEEEQIEKDWEFIRKGIDVDDPEQFMKDFEESRKDRELPHHLLNT